MAAGYVHMRVRALRGLGTTYSFVPRRPGFRGIGQDATAADIFGPAPVVPIVPPLATPEPTAPPLPSSFFTAPAPIIPPAPTLTAPTPPVFGPAGAGPAPPVTIIFPSQGVVATGAPLAPPQVSWLDQQLIPGVSNLFLALGLGGVLLLLNMGGRRRR